MSGESVKARRIGDNKLMRLPEPEMMAFRPHDISTALRQRTAESRHQWSDLLAAMAI